MQIRTMTTDDQADAVRRRMAELRQDLSSDVRDVGRSAREMTDWTHYVRRFPWATVAVAAAIGYMLVPRKKQGISPDPALLAEMVKNREVRVEGLDRAKESKGLLKSLLVMGVTWAAKAGMEYMGSRLRSAALDNRKEPPHPAPAPSPLEEPWQSGGDYER